MKTYIETMQEKLAGLTARLYLFEEIDSTNTFAKSLALQERAVVLAKRQTAGRGRRGKAWDSKGEEDLYISFYEPHVKGDLLGLTLAVALAVTKTLGQFGVTCEIKWPNDILVNGKKLVGILCEANFEKDEIAVIIGIGINVNRSVFPTLAGNIPTSMYLELGHETELPALILMLDEMLRRQLTLFEKEGFLGMQREYEKYSVTLGTQIKAGDTEGLCIGFSERGGILLQQENCTTPIEVFTGIIEEV
ncbi:MAG: biotin--[acetyl-CoA-carboxylase] ligase [Christensenellaceae bacterium]|jgi:BirA family biotin operon repressor/biotin-[acetyl-CoA-carboxylase] ligase